MKHKTIFFIIFLTMILTLYNPGFYQIKGGENQNPGVLLAVAGELTIEEPKLVIGRSQSMPVFKAGEEGTLMIPVENVHAGAARNVNVSLLIDDVQKFPFELEKMSFQTGMSSIDGFSSESAIFFGIKVTPTAESKIYPIGVKIDYTSENGNEGQTSGTVFVKIDNDKKTPLLKLAGIQLENDQIDSGESKIVQLKLKNDGDLTAKDIDVKLSGFTTNGLRLDQPLDSFNLKEFKGKEFKFIPFQIYADPSLESGTYSLDLIMKYKDAFNQEYSKEEKVYITVQGSGTEGKNPKATPRLIINDYQFGSEYVEAGQTFPLVMSLYNTSQSKDLVNIKVCLSSEENIFSPVKSSNTFFIDKIPAGSSLPKVIQLKPKIDASNKTYNITADIEYEDEKGNKFSSKELIGIPVAQEVNLVISDIELPEECFVGTPMGISVDYYNTGRAVLRNLLINTQGDFTVKGGKVYIGNLEAGKSDYYDVNIIPQREGTLKGKITFDYDDDSGRHYQIEKEVKIEVMKPVASPPPNLDPDLVKKQGTKWKIPAIIGAGIFVLGMVAFIVRRKQIKNQEDVSFDE